MKKIFIDKRTTKSGRKSFLNVNTTVDLYKYIKTIHDTSEFVKDTYANLSSKKDNNQLTAGTYYIISDFQSCYDQPDYDINGNAITGPEIYKQGIVNPIIVQANSTSTLSPYAYQVEYPNDIIQYDIDFTSTEITGGPAFGRITERIDEYGNRTDYDHRDIKFKRYRTYYYNTDSPLSGTITINGTNTALGTSTLFQSELNVGNVVVINFKNYKVTNIISDTEIEIEGISIDSVIDVPYFKGQPQVDGEESNIPYTHTQMTDPPVDDNEEAQPSDFIMDGTIQPSNLYFGSGSEYFTNLYPGMFVMAAKNINIEYFKIDGNSGADGDGTVDNYVYATNYDGKDYTAYVKRVYNADDPSINQIIIVNTDGTGITQNYDNSSEDDFHELTGLNNVTELHYLLLARFNPDDKIDDSTIDSIVDAYLTINNNDNLNVLLTGLNSDYENITSLVPDLFLFNDVDDGIAGGIDDGGEDMYDGANYIYTDRTAKWRSYDWKENNIVDDIYREITTFRSVDELEINGQVTSVSNYIGDYSKYYLNTNLSVSPFLLSNITFGLYSYGNTLGDRCFNVGTYNWFNRNQISGTFQRNTIKKGFYANVIGEYFTDNQIYSQCWRNKIGENFENNFLGNRDFQNNVINNGFNNNKVSLYDDFYKNSISNGFKDNEILEEFYGNHIGNAFNGNQIYNVFSDNHILDYFENNTIGNSAFIGSYNFSDNIIGNNFNENLAEGNFFKNHIGHSFVSNESETEFRNNVIGNNFLDNNVGQEFAYNIIGDSFGNNTIGNSFGYGGSVLRGNKIGNSFAGNTIGVDCYDNVIGNNFQTNTIVDYFKYNQILYPISATNFSTATHVYADYNCTVIRSSDTNYYLQYFDGTDTQSVSITA
jgi:hypothetical protein